MNKFSTLALFILSSVALLLACNNKNSTSTESSDSPLELKILHINDHHSHLQQDSGTGLTLGGEATRVVMGGFPRVVSKIEELAATSNNVLKLHAGDALTGDLY